MEDVTSRLSIYLWLRLVAALLRVRLLVRVILLPLQMETNHGDESLPHLTEDNLASLARRSYVLGPEGDPGGASLLAGPPAIPYRAGLGLVLSLLFLLLSVRFCRQEAEREAVRTAGRAPWPLKTLIVLTRPGSRERSDGGIGQ